MLCTFRMHFIFVRKTVRTKYTKITCIRNILDLQYTDFDTGVTGMILFWIPTKNQAGGLGGGGGGGRCEPPPPQRGSRQRPGSFQNLWFLSPQRTYFGQF